MYEDNDDDWDNDVVEEGGKKVEQVVERKKQERKVERVVEKKK